MPSGGFLIFLERSDAHLCVRLPVALFLCVTALLAVAEHDFLRILASLDEFPYDFRTLYVRRPDGRLGTVVGEEDFVKSDLGAYLVDTHGFNINNAVLGDDVLLAARLYDGDFGHGERILQCLAEGGKRP
jgi:hypothetical protein